MLRLRQFSRHATDLLTEAARSRKRPTAGIDVFQVLLPNLISIAGTAARRLRADCFWEMPNILSNRIPFDINRRVYQWQLARSGIHVLANSRYSASSLGDGPVKPSVLYLGVDSRRFDPARFLARPLGDGPAEQPSPALSPVARAELRVPADATVFALFARVHPVKGQDRVMEAVAALANEAAAGDAGGPIHVLMVGGPDDLGFAARVKQIAAAAGRSERLHFLDRVPDPERYYPAIDIAVNWNIGPEPYGLSVIEAMMMAKPVLVHAAGGPAETVLDGRTGWHVGDASVASLVGGMRRALADRDRWPQMGLAARAHAVSHFSVERHVASYRQFVDGAREARMHGKVRPT